MSYTHHIKEKICLDVPHKLCCRKSLINGLLVASSTEQEGGNITVKLGDSVVISYFVRLIEEAYHQACEIAPLPGRGKYAELRFYSKSASQYLSNIEREPAYPVHNDYKCENCRCSFLTGIFLGCGHASVPESGYRLDLTPQGRLAFIKNYLELNGVPPLSTIRQGKQILYYRSNETISDFFGLIKQIDEYFRMQNAYFTRDLNNVTNRQNNCTIGNIERSVRSGAQQIRVIRILAERHLLSQLPDELRETAELRLKYEDLSLSQLAMVSSPPLTKSGLNHRLKKIMAFAEEHHITP